MFIYFDINIVPRQSERALYVDYFIIQDKCHVFLCENTFSNNVRIPILLSSLKSGRGSEYGFSSWPSCPIFIHLSLMICCKVNKQKFLKKKVKLQYYFSRSSLSINALCICVYIYIKFDQPQLVNVAFPELFPNIIHLLLTRLYQLTTRTLMLSMCSYIYIRQLCSFRAPTLWFIDPTDATCHVQYTFLNLCQFFSQENGQKTKIL